ncbi:hypothetical protein TWF730_008787 [Orbilia blumenaviensis]|uniref:F-box domain-containing protein n=1 Tax=Orbilia blumenaviensis TaxID=1796055 RepID=A0AAV9V4L5_9PEZI
MSTNEASNTTIPPPTVDAVINSPTPPTATPPVSDTHETTSAPPPPPQSSDSDAVVLEDQATPSSSSSSDGRMTPSSSSDSSLDGRVTPVESSGGDLEVVEQIDAIGTDNVGSVALTGQEPVLPVQEIRDEAPVLDTPEPREGEDNNTSLSLPSSSAAAAVNGGTVTEAADEDNTPTSSEPSTPTTNIITASEEAAATDEVIEGSTEAVVRDEIVEAAREEGEVATVDREAGGEGNAIDAAVEENATVGGVEGNIAAVVVGGNETTVEGGNPTIVEGEGTEPAATEGAVEPVANDAPVVAPDEAVAAVQDAAIQETLAAEGVVAEGNEVVVAEGVEAAPAVEGGDNPPAQAEDEAPAPPPAEGENAPVVPAENEAAPTDPPLETTEETTPAEPEPEPEPWFYDPEKPTTILAIPPEIVLYMFNFLPLEGIKEFSRCSKRCRSLAIRRVFRHVNISADALKAFQKDGVLHHIADAVFGIIIRTRYLGNAGDLCNFMRECMYITPDEGLDVFKAVRRIKVSYGQIRYGRNSPVVQTGPLDSLSRLDAQFIKAMFLSLRKVAFWKRIRWVDFVVKLWEDRHGILDGPEEEDAETSPESKPGYISEENSKFLEDILEWGADDDDKGKDMLAVAPALRDVRLINFKPRRRVVYRKKVDVFEVLAWMGGMPKKVILEYISAGESNDIVPSSKMDQVRVQKNVEEMLVNLCSFQTAGFLEEIGSRFVDLKTLLILTTSAGGTSYLVPAKGSFAPWRREVLEKLEQIKSLKTIMFPVMFGQEGENINYGRRKELGEVPKDAIERLSELVIYWLENGVEGLEKVAFERRESEDEVDSNVGPGWICDIKWVNRRPKLTWEVKNQTVFVF